MSAPDWLVEKVARELCRQNGLGAVDQIMSEDTDWPSMASGFRSAARAVPDLVGPQRLVWHVCSEGIYEAVGFEYMVYSEFDGWTWFPPSGESDGFIHPTLEAAQAAAQSHADEAWWAQTKAAKERDA